MKQHLEIAKKAAIEAGKLITEFLGNAKISEKASNNLVTEADMASETLIRKVIKDAIPGSMILGEEQASDDLTSKKLWIVDPIDGTNNYAHGIPLYCVSIAYAEDGIVKVGVVYDPVRNELFEAVKGEGAKMNSQPIHSSERMTLQESIIATGFYYDRGEIMEKTLCALHRLFKINIRGMRRTGSAAIDMCWVASGRFDGYFEYRIQPWDYAASSLIITEAGGLCHDRNGNELTLSSNNMVCSNRHIHKELLNLVAWDHFSNVNLLW